ncbi:MAG: polysaccharide deacetylase family protein [Lentisphaerota bacterium]
MNFGLIGVMAAFGMGMLGFATVSATQAQDAKPTWELGKNTIDQTAVKGKIELLDGVLKLDGTNSFAIPATVLGAQNDYTIEFEVRKAPGVKGSIFLVSNTDDKNKTGLGLKYCAPDYNAGLLMVNGFQAVEQRGFLDDKFNKVALVAKDKKLTLFRNGLILAMTDAVKAGDLPLSFGEILKEPCTPYEIRSIRIYDTAIFPTGFDQSAERMRNYSGDQYFMQRVDIKNPDLPRILVVGDSISMGYRGFITEHFKGKAYVDYWVGGSWFGETAKGPDSPAKRAWNGVLSNGPYDVISWNAMTLHMWNGAPGRCDESNYPANMTEIVEHLQKTAPNTKLIWIRCTPWRTTPETGRASFDPVRNDVIVRLNKVTDEIIVKHGIPEVDLYSICEKRLDTIPAGSKDSVHWGQDVSREMAGLIIKEIEKLIPEKHKENIGGVAKESPTPGKLKVMQCWDDSLTTDIPMIKLLEKYKAKATFNIIPMKERRSFVVKKLKAEKETLFSFMPKGTQDGFNVEHLNNEEMKEIYKGFKVAAHCGFSNDETPEAVEPRRRVLMDTMTLIRENFHQDKVGFVYPGGGYNKTVMKAVQDAGYLYARTTKSADAPLPLDTPMALPTSCHWNNSQFWDRYEAAKKKGGVFYFWGHSCELGDDPYLWEKLEKIYARISSDPDAEWSDVIDLFEHSANSAGGQ